jgi:hypothetical protein
MYQVTDETTGETRLFDDFNEAAAWCYKVNEK